jgi:hypothetical protein
MSPARRGVKLRPRIRFADEVTHKSWKHSTVAAPKDEPSCLGDESIGSDNVSPPSSETIDSSRFNADVKEFTAIFKITERVRAVAQDLDIDSLHSLAEVLISCLENMLRSFKCFPSRIRSGQKFDVAFRGVIFFGRMFIQHIRTMTTRLSGIQLSDIVQLSLESLDMTMTSLNVLLDLVGCPVPTDKPLPDIPVRSTLRTPPAPLTVQDALVKDSLIPANTPPDHGNLPSMLVTTTGDTSMPSTPLSITKASLRRFVSGLSGKSTRRPLTLWSNTITSKSSASLVLTPRVDESSSGQVTTPATSDPSDKNGSRQKIYVDGVVSVQPSTQRSAQVLPSFSQVFNMEQPLSTADLYFSPKGVLCAASLVGLIRILTSTEAVRGPTFDDFFFRSFRFFSKPLNIFNMLAAQYDEGPREGLNAMQVIVSEQDAKVAKVRVAKVCLLWLRFHWRYKWDMDVLEPLRHFASTRAAVDPGSITWEKVVRKVNDASISVDNPGFRLQRTAQTQPTRRTSTYLPRPCEMLFMNLISQSDCDRVDILHFHSLTGREVFTRQLCLAASELFRHIDPESAVRYWKDGRDQTVKERISRLAAFENGLAYWTSNAITIRPTIRSRAEVMEFFIEVASVRLSNLSAHHPLLLITALQQCVELRNFASGSAISSGIDLCMTRLRETTEVRAPPTCRIAEPEFLRVILGTLRSSQSIGGGVRELVCVTQPEILPLHSGIRNGSCGSPHMCVRIFLLTISA